MAGLIAETCKGIVVDQVIHLTGRTIQRIITFHSARKSLKSTVSNLRPYVRLVVLLDKQLGSPEAETQPFIRCFDKAEQLLEECSKTKWWNLYDRNFYSNRLAKQKRSLNEFFAVDVEAQVLVDVKRTLSKVNRLGKEMEEAIELNKMQCRDLAKEMDKMSKKLDMMFANGTLCNSAPHQVHDPSICHSRRGCTATSTLPHPHPRRSSTLLRRRRSCSQKLKMQ